MLESWTFWLKVFCFAGSLKRWRRSVQGKKTFYMQGIRHLRVIFPRADPGPHKMCLVTVNPFFPEIAIISLIEDSDWSKGKYFFKTSSHSSFEKSCQQFFLQYLFDMVTVCCNTGFYSAVHWSIYSCKYVLHISNCVERINYPLA